MIKIESFCKSVVIVANGDFQEEQLKWEKHRKRLRFEN